MRQLLDPPGRDLMAGLRRAQVDPDQPGVLPSEMNTLDAGRARQGLEAVLRGLMPPP